MPGSDEDLAPYKADLFFNLPLQRRQRLAEQFGLTSPSDPPATDSDQGRLWLRRAKAAGKLKELLDMTKVTAPGPSLRLVQAPEPAPLRLSDVLEAMSITQAPDGSFVRREVTMGDVIRLLADEMERRK